jgi:hypothetical protein
VHDVAVTDTEPVNNEFAQLKFTALVHYTSQLKEPQARTEIQAQLRGTIAFRNGQWAITEPEVESAKIGRTP